MSSRHDLAKLKAACSRKSAYATQRDAEMGIGHFSDRGSRETGRLKAYPCEVPEATHWHLGRVHEARTS